jgi:DNA-binding transcriptional ArsR family regulator
MSASKIAVSVPDHVFTHPAYRALSPIERCLLVELLALARQIGTDEPISCSYDMAADMLNVPRSVAGRALKALRKRGFIRLERDGERRHGAKGGIASGWSLTCLPYRGDPPTCEYNRAHWKAVDKIAPSPPETAFSNAERRTEDEGNLTGIDGGRAQPAPYIQPASGPNIQKLLEILKKKALSEEGGLDRQRSNIGPVAGSRKSERRVLH